MNTWICSACYKAISKEESSLLKGVCIECHDASVAAQTATGQPAAQPNVEQPSASDKDDSGFISTKAPSEERSVASFRANMVFACIVVLCIAWLFSMFDRSELGETTPFQRGDKQLYSLTARVQESGVVSASVMNNSEDDILYAPLLVTVDRCSPEGQALESVDVSYSGRLPAYVIAGEPAFERNGVILPGQELKYFLITPDQEPYSHRYAGEKWTMTFELRWRKAGSVREIVTKELSTPIEE